MDINEKITAQINHDDVVLYMKGDPTMPMCGFSAQVVQILDQYDIDFQSYNILADDDLRQGLKLYSDWPTFPQLYVNGELIGGCDIISEMHDSGELATLLKG